MAEEITLPAGTWSVDTARPLGRAGGFGQVFEGSRRDWTPVAEKRLHVAAEDAHRELETASQVAERTLEYVVPVLNRGEHGGRYPGRPATRRSPPGRTTCT